MRTRLLTLLALGFPATSAAQPNTQRPGPYLFVLDLQGTPLDEFPNAVKALNGIMTVVDKNGQHMLRASSPSELLLTLPQSLPSDFTVEVDLIPKICCNPEDLMVEGTPAMNRGPASAQLSWTPRSLMVVGGGRMYQADMPADLAASTPGNLTRVVMEVSGTTVKLYTNGRRLYTLDRQFVRGRVLRVWLGGENSGNPMYLAGLRIGTGRAAPGVIAGQAGLPGRAGALGGNRAASTGSGSTVSPQPPARSGSSVLSGPATKTGPVNTTGSTAKTAARCQPSGTAGAPPLNYQVGGGRVGGAVIQWWAETGAEYLVERSPDAGNGSRVWSRLTSTCDFPSGLNYYTVRWEDGNDYPVINLSDNVPVLQLDAPYVYRVTVIRSDGTSGSSEASYTTANATFLSSPIAAVNGNTVRVAADISYCTATAYAPFMRCDPWMMELTVTNSSSGYHYSSQQPWKDSYDPHLPLTVPGGVEATYVFIISGVPSGTHTFALTALYQPSFRVAAGFVTVQVP